MSSFCFSFVTNFSFIYFIYIFFLFHSFKSSTFLLSLHPSQVSSHQFYFTITFHAFFSFFFGQFFFPFMSIFPPQFSLLSILSTLLSTFYSLPFLFFSTNVFPLSSYLCLLTFWIGSALLSPNSFFFFFIFPPSPSYQLTLFFEFLSCPLYFVHSLILICLFFSFFPPSLPDPCSRHKALDTQRGLMDANTYKQGSHEPLHFYFHAIFFSSAT